MIGPTEQEIIEAAKRVLASPRFKNIVKNNRRHVVLVLDGITHFVSAGFVGAEVDVPGYAQKYRRHRPRQEGEDLTHERRIMDAGFDLIDPDHPSFENLLEEYLSSTTNRFRLDDKWRHDRVKGGRERDFAFLCRQTISRATVLDAFGEFDSDGAPDGFGTARSWFVAHPVTDQPYPAKMIWGMANGQSGADFTAHQARDGLRRLGFLCAQLDSGDHHPETVPQPLLEGAERQFTGSRRERNPVARQLCIEYHTRDGRLACAVCDVDFGEAYGPLGDGFIHIHHLDQLADAESEREIDPTEDLVPVCPNCHAMIHRGGANRPIADVRKAWSEANRILE